MSMLSSFEQFAVAATIDVNQFNTFLNQQKAAQSAQPQSEIRTYHTDTSSHDDYTYHYGSYSYTNSPHTDYTYTYGSYSDLGYYYVDSAHGNYYDNGWSYTQNGSGKTSHADRYSNSPHQDYKGHTDRYTQSTGYSNKAHSDYYTYSQHSAYGQYSQHNDSGVDHDNFVPYTPSFYELVNDIQLNGSVQIGFYSYDKNKDGYGSQLSESLTVQHTLEVRQVADRFNQAITPTAWITLVSNSLNNTYTFNTVDPLGTGNINKVTCNGYYELRITASNPNISGVPDSFISPSTVVRVHIDQNSPADLTVSNADEFINFYFSNYGLVKAGVSYKPFSSAWANPVPSKTNGLYVMVSMIDPDNPATSISNWQKGLVYIEDAPGHQLTVPVDVIWDDSGTNITNSSNSLKKGYAFIPITNLMSFTGANRTIVVQIHEYSDAACTTKVGPYIEHRQVSNVDTRTMYINIGDFQPSLSAALSRNIFSAIGPYDTATVTGNLLDVYSGSTEQLFYRVDGSAGQAGTFLTGLASASGSSQAYSTSINIGSLSEGSHIIYFWSLDSLGLKSSEVPIDIVVDKTAPTASTSNNNFNWVNSNIPVALTYADSASGVSVRQYAVTANTTVPSSWNNYTASITISTDGQYYVHYRTVDNVGNTRVGYFGPYKLDKSLPTMTCDKAIGTYVTSVTPTVTVVDAVSGLSQISYQWSNSTARPATGYTNINVGSSNNYPFSTTQNTPGTWYLHVIATDNAGNESYVCFGALTVIPLSITNFHVTGSWNHWGKATTYTDLSGHVCPPNPLRFLSLEKIKITVSTSGYADKVEFRLSPELENMYYNDGNGNQYDYYDYFNKRLSFPADSTFALNSSVKDNTFTWEYCLPLAPSTISWDNDPSPLHTPYYIKVTIFKGGVSISETITGINVTGNVYDITHVQAN